MPDCIQMHFSCWICGVSMRMYYSCVHVNQKMRKWIETHEKDAMFSECTFTNNDVNNAPQQLWFTKPHMRMMLPNCEKIKCSWKRCHKARKCTDKSRMNRSITKFLSLCVLDFPPCESLCFPFNCVLGPRRQLSSTRPWTIPSTCSDHEQITARCEDVQRKSAATELPRRRPLRTDLLWEEYKPIHTTIQPHQEVLNSDQWHFTKEYYRQLSRIRVKQKVINVLHPSTTRANTTLKANHQSNQVVRLHQDFRPSTIFCKNLTRQLIFVHHQQSNWTRQISNFQLAWVYLHFPWE